MNREHDTIERATGLPGRRVFGTPAVVEPAPGGAEDGCLPPRRHGRATAEMPEKLKTFKRSSWRRGLALIFLNAITLLSGCATLGAKPRVTVSEVIQMTKEGITPETIVKTMRDSGTVYRLTAAQLAQLHDQGVADPVIDHMRETYLNAVRREQSLTEWDSRESMWGPGFW
jgi:hypothetical protein